MPPDETPPSTPDRPQAWQRPAARVRPVAALADRLVLEVARGARQGVPFSVLALHHIFCHDEDEAACERLRDHVLRNVAAHLRVSDAVYHAGYPGCHVIVLPHTPAANVGVVVRRIEERLETEASDIGPARLDVIPTHGGETDAGALLERIARHFADRYLRPNVHPAARFPPARLPVGDLSRLEEALHTEINLAGRDGTSLSVIALVAPARAETIPGLLACDVDEIAARTVRGCDQVFELGPAGVALILARTHPADAAKVAERVVAELREQDPAAPHGDLTTTVLEFDREHRDTTAFIDALRHLAR